jgi:hypothetical protein
MPDTMSTQEERVYSETAADPLEPDESDDVPEQGDQLPAGRPDHEGDDGESERIPPDAPPPVPPAGSLTPEEFEARARKVAQAFVRYTKTVTDQLATLADDLTPCPLCPELHPGFVNVHDAGRMPPEVAQVVDMFLGRTLEAEYKDNAETGACEACDGLGKVRSGSKVAHFALLTCPRCQGTGFFPPPNSGAPVQVTGAPVAAVADGEPFRAAQADADPFGSPRLLTNGTENPNYGKMPQFKDSTLP